MAPLLRERSSPTHLSAGVKQAHLTEEQDAVRVFAEVKEGVETGEWCPPRAGES